MATKWCFSVLVCLGAVAPTVGVESDRALRAGAASVDITPRQFPVVVSGGFLSRTATRARDKLASRALVLDDGRTRIAIVVVDTLMFRRELLDPVKEEARLATGIPVDRQLICATHTHSAPSVMGALGTPVDEAYAQFLPARIVEALLALLEKVSGRPRALRRPPVDPYLRAVQASRPAALWRLDEMEGRTAEDASGNGRDGRYEPGVAFFLPGRSPSDLVPAERTPNRAVHLAGGRVRVPLPTGRTSYSVELWFWNGLPEEAREVTAHLFGFRRKGGAESDLLGIGGAGGSPGRLFFSDGARDRLVGRTAVTSGIWNHVVVVRDESRVAVYLNGNLKPEIGGEAAPLLRRGTELVLGGSAEPGSSLEGKLDDVSFYERALSPEEISTHYRVSGF